MSDPKSVFLFGYSGHAYVIIESLLDAGFHIAGYFDLKETEFNPYNLPYLGFEKSVDVKSIVKDSLVFPAVGENNIRAKLIHFFEVLNLKQFVLIDPSANVSNTALISVSTYIGKKVSINAQSKIGKGSIINTNSVIEHECKIGDYVHIAPGSVLCGNVTVGNSSFIGANTVIKQNTSICSKVTIGAGSVVVKNINFEGVYFGNPVIRKEGNGSKE
ncbi:acetyltransferase [Cecembia lonarensis]|uniref:UDP-3-O-[3-hydroxymyristoyl] glucosamine N-acyltransferase n=1 Tax=Cecembia lonarensis (strain CCUG 58316 / KCTC 22772 / LW9) TaxID=1225176 RepID=K1L1I0_CECL9|nr:acetyltransferase [Cecembia lonarensis]EKB48616.1 UDP-3-O-[3-hydroxymyristoyl] glucosamine N-acyltransferase [Cecembia lonarensis LW9]